MKQNTSQKKFSIIFIFYTSIVTKVANEVGIQTLDILIR